LTTLAIAGWRVRLDCSLPVVDAAVAAHFRAFVVPDDAANDAWVTVSLDPDVPAVSLPVFRATRQRDSCLLDMPGIRGIIDINSLQGTARLGRRGLRLNIEFFLKALFAYMAFSHGGLLLHCSGVLSGREAYLFTGEGGSGKSTVVSLLPHRLALNDDMVVLRPDGRGWRAYGTPFWNVETTRRCGQTADGRVAGIYRLAQDQQVYLEPMANAVAISELIANCPVVNTDPVALPALMNRCRELAETVKLQRLHFRKSADFWPLLHAGNTE